MFNRIRYAAEVLSYSPPKVHPRDQPDIIFREEDRSEVKKTSRVIGNLIEALLVCFAVTYIAVPIMHRLFAGRSSASLLTLTGFTASLLSLLGWRVFEKINAHIRLQLKIGEKIAPYFGHKITRAVQILRG